MPSPNKIYLLTLSHVLDFHRHISWSFLCLVSWDESCLFILLILVDWWNCWPSLSFHNQLKWIAIWYPEISHSSCLFQLIITRLLKFEGPWCSWSYGSWIYNYMCNKYLSSLKLRVEEPLLWRGELDTTLIDKVCQWFVTGRWFSPSIPVSSSNKTNRYNITEILLKVALNTINKTEPLTECIV